VQGEEAVRWEGPSGPDFAGTRAEVGFHGACMVMNAKVLARVLAVVFCVVFLPVLAFVVIHDLINLPSTVKETWAYYIVSPANLAIPFVAVPVLFSFAWIIHKRFLRLLPETQLWIKLVGWGLVNIVSSIAAPIQIWMTVRLIRPYRFVNPAGQVMTFDPVNTWVKYAFLTLSCAFVIVLLWSWIGWIRAIRRRPDSEHPSHNSFMM
jgi:hypothetical protein